MTCAVGGAYHAESMEERDDQKRSVTRFEKEIKSTYSGQTIASFGHLNVTSVSGIK